MSRADHPHRAESEPGTWRKSTHSNPSGECVELTALDNGQIAVRNSRFPTGDLLIFPPAALAAFILSVHAHEFDDLLQTPQPE
jgi:hypothetical protein